MGGNRLFGGPLADDLQRVFVDQQIAFALFIVFVGKGQFAVADDIGGRNPDVCRHRAVAREVPAVFPVGYLCETPVVIFKTSDVQLVVTLLGEFVLADYYAFQGVESDLDSGVEQSPFDRGRVYVQDGIL